MSIRRFSLGHVAFPMSENPTGSPTAPPLYRFGTMQNPALLVLSGQMTPRILRGTKRPCSGSPVPAAHPPETKACGMASYAATSLLPIQQLRSSHLRVSSRREYRR